MSYNPRQHKYLLSLLTKYTFLHNCPKTDLHRTSVNTSTERPHMAPKHCSRGAKMPTSQDRSCFHVTALDPGHIMPPSPDDTIHFPVRTNKLLYIDIPTNTADQNLVIELMTTLLSRLNNICDTLVSVIELDLLYVLDIPSLLYHHHISLVSHFH